jgi:hypothetical protein
MVKCPFCHFDNEDGALFCEQCKSDLAGVEPVEGAEPVGAVMAEIVETVPLVSIPEGTPVVEAVMAEPVMGESVTAGVPIVEAVPLSEATPIPLAPDVPSIPPMAPPVQVAPPPVQMTPPSAPTATPSSVPTSTAPSAAPAAPLPPDAQPRLLVLRGLKRNIEYPLYEGPNFIGRADEKPVDIDLDDQEPPDRVWSSRQHAVVTFEGGKLLVEDLNSSNGTFVNRTRIYPGQKRELAVNDVIQIGTVQMKVIV